MKRKLIIDAQLFHTPAWHRGMGKYSTELIAAVNYLNSQKKCWDSIELILSSRIPMEPGVLSTIKKQTKLSKVVRLDLSRDEITNAVAVMERNRRSIDNYIGSILAKGSTTKIDFLILSPMQGGVCSVFPSDEKVRKSVIFYDLIPFMFHDMYFKNPVAKMESLTKVGELLRADRYLSISKTVANDLAIYMGVDPSRIKNIDGGAITHARKSKKILVNKPFILMPTGNELRKNNRTGILGFNTFNNRHDNKFTLVVTSTFDPDQVAELSRYSDKVTFTGNITGEELNYLYEQCDALLFPSEYEGLGLPVLEAVEKNKPVACSDISVFREISETAFNFFDPDYGTSIASALEKTLDSAVDKALYTSILERYSWGGTAEAFVNALSYKDDEIASIGRQIAIFAPNPSCDSPSTRMVQRLHSELSRRYTPTYFLDGEPSHDSFRPNMLPFISPTTDIIEDVPIMVDDYKIKIYHIDNGEDSSKILFTALANPGIVILHDLDLRKTWDYLKNGLSLISLSRYNTELSLDEKYSNSQANMLISLINSQKAIIVFSLESKKIILGLAKNIGVDIQVKVACYPISSLVYGELCSGDDMFGSFESAAVDRGWAMFEKSDSKGLEKVVIGCDSSNETSRQSNQFVTLKISNDRQLEKSLSKLSLSFCYDKTTDLLALESSRYGAIPICLIGSRTNLVDFPSSTIFVSNLRDLDRELDSFTRNKNQQASHDKVQNEARKDYSFRSFLNTLDGLIAKVDFEGLDT